MRRTVGVLFFWPGSTEKANVQAMSIAVKTTSLQIYKPADIVKTAANSPLFPCFPNPSQKNKAHPIKTTLENTDNGKTHSGKLRSREHVNFIGFPYVSYTYRFKWKKTICIRVTIAKCTHRVDFSRFLLAGLVKPS